MINFPDAPTVGQIVAGADDLWWEWTGSTWDLQSSGSATWVSLTQAQFDALAVKDPNTLYVIIP